MKTADSIEQQPERKAARDNGDLSPENTPPSRQKFKQRDATRIAPWKWQPGHCPNPGGRPKHDLAADLARACFENNMPALYKAFSKALLRGNGYVFKELADRGYGRLKERIEVDRGPHGDTPTEDLANEIERLEIALGFRRKTEEEPPPVNGESKPN